MAFPAMAIPGQSGFDLCLDVVALDFMTGLARHGGVTSVRMEFALFLVARGAGVFFRYRSSLAGWNLRLPFPGFFSGRSVDRLRRAVRSPGAALEHQSDRSDRKNENQDSPLGGPGPGLVMGWRSQILGHHGILARSECLTGRFRGFQHLDFLTVLYHLPADHFWGYNGSGPSGPDRRHPANKPAVIGKRAAGATE